MTSFLDKNLAILGKRQPQLAGFLTGISPAPADIFPSSKGLPTARTKRSDGTVVHLHSRYDPMQEARRFIQKVDLEGADYFILLGFGLGYNLDALAEATSSSECRYFVIESDPGILKAALQARDLSRVLSLPRLHFAWPAEGPELGRQWMEFFDPVHARGSAFINHPPSLTLAPDFFKSAAQIIQSQTFQIFTDINTLVNKSKVFLDNFVANVQLALESPGVSEFAGQMTGVPAVIVSAGPSLDLNIHELREIKEGAIILSTDTALKPLLSAGIVPHFVLSGDPSHANYLHVKGAQSGYAIFVIEATGSPEVFREFRGHTVTCTFENSTLGSLSSLLASKGQLRAWGSVATMALDFALHLRCDPIIFVGQDLAYSEGRTYCTGLHWEEELFAGVSTPEQWKACWESLVTSRPTITMMDIHGNPVRTTDKLAAYWNWIGKEIQAHPEIRFINATEGGILRDSVTVMSLREAIYRHCRKDLGLTLRLQKLVDGAKARESDPVDSVMVPIRNDSLRLRELLSRGKEICRADAHFPAESLLQALERVKSSIYRNARVAPLLDTFNQMGNVTFLRRQATFAHSSGSASDPTSIQHAYSDFFDSMLSALDVIDSAISRLVLPPHSGEH